MKPIENELEQRSMLSKDKYFEIVSNVFFLEEKYQSFDITNRYFDDDSLSLYHHKIVLRSREIKDEIVLTLKLTKEDGSSIEVSQEINNFQHQMLINNFELPKGIVKLKLHELQVDYSKVRYKGMNKVRRIEVHHGDSLICIDKMNLGEIEEYNIEVESSSMGKASEILKDLSKKYSFEITKDYLSKAYRTLKNGD